MVSQASMEQELFLQEIPQGKAPRPPPEKEHNPDLTAPGQGSQSLKWLPPQVLSDVKG